jgi:putative NIF3 family GTP cyclohydrolase 1 type 2
MNVQDIQNLSVDLGKKADARSPERITHILDRKKAKFEKLPNEEKHEFDQDSLSNPYSDSKILNIADNREVKKVLVGIDIEPAELLIAKHLGDIDLVISHHPSARALADLHEVMELQVDILAQYGVSVNVAEGLLKERVAEVARGTNPRNNWRTVDAAKLLGVNLMCMHTTADNNAAKFLKDKLEGQNPEYVDDVLKLLRNIPEYKQAGVIGAGPRLYVGSVENRAGKVAVGFTGGTEGSPKLYEKMAQAGIGTLVDMHASEEHKKEADAANLNVVIAGHMSSDSIGMNVILDELEKQGIEVVPCSGLIRISR